MPKIKEHERATAGSAMPYRSGVASALLVVLLCACNPAPKYVKPAAPSPVTYKESAPPEFKEGKGWRVAQPGDDKLRPKWWELYHDEQLNALEEQVPSGNQNLAASEAKLSCRESAGRFGAFRLVPDHWSIARLFEFPHLRNSRRACDRAGRSRRQFQPRGIQ